MYVANSEPTIWPRGGGRAGVAERDLISGEPNRGEVGRDMGEVVRLTQGSPPDLTSEAARRLENRSDKENPKRGGVRGWQIHG
jgi:hypothetical protein